MTGPTGRPESVLRLSTWMRGLAPALMASLSEMGARVLSVSTTFAPAAVAHAGSDAVILAATARGNPSCTQSYAYAALLGTQRRRHVSARNGLMYPVSTVQSVPTGRCPSRVFVPFT
jgi:hypothetical protein